MRTFSGTKQGMGFLSGIIAIVVLVLVAMIGTIGLFEIGEDFIIERTANATRDAMNQTNVSQWYVNQTDKFQSEYENTDLNFDVMLAAILLAGVVGLMVTAARSEPASPPVFYFGITIGTFIVALVMFVFGQFVDWYLNDFFYVLFDGVKQNNQIVNWFFEYLEFNVIVLYILSWILKQIQIDFGKLSGQGRREQ